MRPPTLRQIEAFRAVIEAGTVSKAAEVLRISQPAASKLLITLEEDTGLRLFDRESGRLVLTERGMRLYEEINRIFAGVDQIGRAVEMVRREDRGHLQIGLMPALSGRFIAEVISRFLAQHPTVHVSVDTRASQFIVEWLLTRQLDVAILTTVPDKADLAVMPLIEEPFCCILPLNHPKARFSCLTPRDLADEALVAFAPNSYTRGRVEEVFEREGVKPKNTLEATTASTVCEFVAAGLGVAVVHPLMVEQARERVAIRTFRPAVESGFLICRPQPVRNRELVDSFIALAQDVAKNTVLSIRPSFRPPNGQTP